MQWFVRRANFGGFMRLRIIAAPILVLSLAGCGTFNTVSAATTGTLASIAPDAVLTAKKALIAAHEVHKASADLLVLAAQSSLCKSQCAVTAKGLLDQSEAILVAGDALAKLGDAPGVNAKIAAASELTGRVNSMLGRN